jgi:hypothetical protein
VANTERKFIAFRRRERPKIRWEDNVKQSLNVGKIYYWKKLRTGEKRTNEQAKTHKELWHYQEKKNTKVAG